MIRPQRIGIQKGFSLMELLVVVAIIAIVTAIAIPVVKQSTATFQLDASGHVVAGLLQTAKETAIKTSQPYYVQYNGAGTQLAFAIPAVRSDNPPDAANYNSSTDPTASLTGNVSFQTVASTGGGPPDHSQLDSYLGGAAVQIETSGVIGFNARGLPCMASTGSEWICSQTDPTAGGTPAFEWFMQNSITNGWVAVTVSPAGRIKTWRLTSSNGGGCGFAACWQ